MDVSELRRTVSMPIKVTTSALKMKTAFSSSVFILYITINAYFPSTLHIPLLYCAVNQCSMFRPNILHSFVLKLAYIASIASKTRAFHPKYNFQVWGQFLLKQCSSVAHKTFAKNLYKLSVYKLLQLKFI
jgi:hypothetical protein